MTCQKHKCPTLKSNIIWYLTIMALFLFIVAFLQSGNTLGSSSQLARPIFFLANLTFRPYKSASLECHHSHHVSVISVVELWKAEIVASAIGLVPISRPVIFIVAFTLNFPFLSYGIGVTCAPSCVTKTPPIA